MIDRGFARDEKTLLAAEALPTSRKGKGHQIRDGRAFFEIHQAAGPSEFGQACKHGLGPLLASTGQQVFSTSACQ